MESRKTLIQQQAETSIVKKQGQALAEAKAKSESLKIEGTSQVAAAQNSVKAKEIEKTAEKELFNERFQNELAH